jgi:hypothetical protein
MVCSKHSMLERPRSGHVTSPRVSGERQKMGAQVREIPNHSNRSVS